MLVLPHAQDELFRPLPDGVWPLHNELAGRKSGKRTGGPLANRESCGFCRQMRVAELQLLRKRDGRASGQKRKLHNETEPQQRRRGLHAPLFLPFEIAPCDLRRLYRWIFRIFRWRRLGAPRPRVR